MANIAPRDGNLVPCLLGTSSADGVSPVKLYADPDTHRLLTQSSGGGAPDDATYVLVSSNVSLPDSRVLTGTANQVVVTDNGAGSTIVLSLPQSIATSSTPTFASMTLTAASSLTLGTASTNTGQIILRNSTNANTLTLQAGATGGNITFTLPTDDGDSGEVLTTNGSGVLTWEAAAGAGTVTDVSVVSANGFAGTVATSTTTPAITLSTTITGILEGNGTAISAASTTGSGAVVLATSPTLVTPVLGVATATSINKVAITAPATSATLTIADGVTLSVSNSMTLAGPTGTGDVVFATSPTLVTPVLGVATATSINGLTITSSTGTLTITNAKTLSVSNTLTLAGTDGTTMTFPTTTATIARTDAGQTFTGVQVMTSPDLTTPLLKGSTITSNQNIAALPTADHTANGPTTSIFNLGATIALMDLVYLGSASKWLLTDADAAATASGMLGICLDGGGDTDTTTVALSGSFVRDDTWNWTPGATLYIDTATPGQITATKPSGTDDVVRVVGFATTADSIYFCPSPDYYTAV